MSSKVREKGEKVRHFLLERIAAGDNDVVAAASTKFGITRQATHKHLTRLQTQGAIIREGSTRVPLYRLAPLSSVNFSYARDGTLAEDLVWSSAIKPALEPLPDNVLNIWNHGFTEMFNNAIDHSDGTTIKVSIRKNALNTEIVISDDGVGIFKKIQAQFKLLDERHAIFELSKGKLTTDPRNHSGEGIFFTSRMFDSFGILSGGLFFDHKRAGHDDWLVERELSAQGTAVFMELNNHTARTSKKIFDEFSSGDDYEFSKTIVPVSLAKYGTDELVSRSQAKRLLARVDLFKTVVFDFENVSVIGQAFADQIFRVFANEHPDIQLLDVGTNAAVDAMIRRARARTEGA